MRVHSFESLALVDGEGVRYAVFLCGCPLRCVYCHNPDTWTSVGGEYSPKQLCDKIVRMKPYFEEVGGGVTFSGGEPLLQADEIVATGALLKKNGINYALDTSGAIELTDSVKAAVLGAELVICDLKFYNSADYKKYCGADFALVLAFLDFVAKNRIKLWVRTVIVPTINDTKEAVREYINVLEPYKKAVAKYQLLGFHTMGFFKYEWLKLTNPLLGYSALDENVLADLQRIADKLLINVTN